MADRMSFDTSEVRALAADLTRAGSGVAAKVQPVVKKGAQNIKEQMQREMGQSAHFGHIAASINYDISATSGAGGGAIEAEIGPDISRVYGGGRHRRPGPLAGVAWFGSSRGGGTVPDPIGALNAEAPRFEAALLDVLGDLLR